MRLRHELSSAGIIRLGGPIGSGKSKSLREVSELLTADGVEHALIHHEDPDPLATIAQLPVHGVYLFDGVEYASPEVIKALIDHARTGSGISTIRNDRANSLYDSTINSIVDTHPDTANIVARTRHFQLAPLTQGEAIQIAVQSGHILDSVTMRAVIHLAWGRPGWLIDLLQIAAAGKAGADPHPTVFELDSSDLLLPVVREMLETTQTALSPEARAAAVTLSQLEARSLGGTVDLFGADIVRELLDATVLIATPDDSSMLGVPKIYGAALRPLTDTSLQQRTNVLAATRLLEQENLGIPLPTGEAAFCVRNLRRRTSGARTPGLPDLDARSLASTHAQLVEQFASALISFGRPEARDLLLRIRSIDGLSELPGSKQ